MIYQRGDMPKQPPEILKVGTNLNLSQMKKFFSVLILGAVLSMPMGLSANADVKSKPLAKCTIDVLAKCTIDVEGFYASGRCNKVLKAYREFKSISKN